MTNITWYIIMLLLLVFAIGLPIIFGINTYIITLMLIITFIIIPALLYLFFPYIQKLEREIEEAARKIVKKD